MLKLICNIKCGYENLYIVEKDAEFPLDFLTDEKLFAATFNSNANGKLPTERELYDKYISNPAKLIGDYGLFPIIRSIIGAEYLLKFFGIINDKSHPFFPELFRIEDLRLSVSTNDANFEALLNKAAEEAKDAAGGQDESDDDYDDFDLPPAKHTA